MSPYLTDAEILGIVAPLKQPAAIVRWFRREGFEIRVRPNGMPLISRAHFDAMTNKPLPASLPPDSPVLNVAGLMQIISKRVGYGHHGPKAQKQSS